MMMMAEAEFVLMVLLVLLVTMLLGSGIWPLWCCMMVIVAAPWCCDGYNGAVVVPWREFMVLKSWCLVIW